MNIKNPVNNYNLFYGRIMRGNSFISFKEAMGLATFNMNFHPIRILGIRVVLTKRLERKW